VSDETGRRLALVLDTDDLDDAAALARRLAPWFGVAKVGLELWAAAGPAAVTRLQDLGFQVFLDLKLHDIPNQVGRAARVLGRLGLAYLNAHAAGGEAMLRAFVAGARTGAAETNVAPPALLGVTVLTSDADDQEFEARLLVAARAGCDGIVCSGHEIARLKRAHPEFVAVVPGVRLAGDDPHDQARVVTPAEAIRSGADVLVVGRTVTQADDVDAAAQRVHDEVARAIGEAPIADGARQHRAI
jgi:orotidine-5'-phosphate decarboxylase